MNHGKKWTEVDCQKLLGMASKHKSIRRMAKKLDRSENSILCKLTNLIENSVDDEHSITERIIEHLPKHESKKEFMRRIERYNESKELNTRRVYQQSTRIRLTDVMKEILEIKNFLHHHFRKMPFVDGDDGDEV